MPRNKDTGEGSRVTVRQETQAEGEVVQTTGPFQNSNGDFELYPSEVEGLATANNLTRDEAERVARGENVDAVKSGRVVYRQAFEKVPADVHTHPLLAADATRAAAERAADEETSEPTADPTRPEAGQWGPYADYRVVEVSDEEVAQQSGRPLDEVKKARADVGVTGKVG